VNTTRPRSWSRINRRAKPDCRESSLRPCWRPGGRHVEVHGAGKPVGMSEATRVAVPLLLHGVDAERGAMAVAVERRQRVPEIALAPGQTFLLLPMAGPRWLLPRHCRRAPALSGGSVSTPRRSPRSRNRRPNREAATKKRRSTVPDLFHDSRGKAAASPWPDEPP
jgi:hypothetical protein